MRIVITNAGEWSEKIADFLTEKVSKWIRISDVCIETYCPKHAKMRGITGREKDEVSFELLSDTDPFPDDYQMMILTNAFSGTNLQFLIPATGFQWIIA